MFEKLPEDFDGFITPEGELISIEDADRMYGILMKSTENPDKLILVLRGFADECLAHGRFGAACAYLEKSLPLVESPGDKASCLLMIGQAWEHAGDCKAARAAYQRAFTLPQEKNDTWYFLNNNLAFCLNKEGGHKEAEQHCRAAIKVNRRRHNAYKNLGVALEGQGRYVDAARNYLRAARLHPADTRAAELLERLMDAYAETLNGAPKLRAQLHKYQAETGTSTNRYRVH